MSREPDPTTRAIALAAGVALTLGAAGWLITQLATLLATGHPNHTPATELIRTLRPHGMHTGDGPPPRWAIAIAILLLAALLTVAGPTATLLRPSRIHPRTTAWASGRDIAQHLSLAAACRRTAHLEHPKDAARATVPLGRDTRTRRRLHGSAEDSYLVLGPPRCGKGIHLVIPVTLAAPGAVIVTATRPDTYQHTHSRRAARGPIAVFDPQHLAPDAPRLRWSPVHGCDDPLTAISRARALAAGAQLSAASTTNGDFWQAMTEATLRCYLHAAALDQLTMRAVCGWIARPADPTPARILRRHPDAAPGWADELSAQTGADPRQRDSVWAGLRRAVDALADPRVLDACSPDPDRAFDPAAFLSQGGSLYLLGSPGTQLSLAPLITALVETVLETARMQAAATTTGRLTPPLRLILDEAANIAPLPALPALLADGGGAGITTLVVLQSLAQARARWGPAGADAMWDAATIKTIFGGLAHVEDLTAIARLAGDTDRPSVSHTTGDGERRTTRGTERLPALGVDTVRTLPPGHALLVARRTRLVQTRLDPWWTQ